MSTTIKIERRKLFPVPGRSCGQAWRWTYTYRIDDGPACQYGTHLASLRSMLRRKHSSAKVICEWTQGTTTTTTHGGK